MIEKIYEKYLNESSFDIGDWISQEGSDYIIYGKIIEELKNKAYKAVIFQSFDGGTSGKAVFKSTKGWFPAPKKIQEKDVPPKIKQKIEDKAGK